MRLQSSHTGGGAGGREALTTFELYAPFPLLPLIFLPRCQILVINNSDDRGEFYDNAYYTYEFGVERDA
jgi:hypothetical protein